MSGLGKPQQRVPPLVCVITWIRALRDAQVLISGVCDVTLYERSTFTDAIKLRIWRWGGNAGLSPGWALNAISGLLYQEGGRGGFEQKRRRQCDHRGWIGGMKPWVRRRGTDSSLEPPEGAWPCWHIDFSPEILIFAFLAFRIMREWISVVWSHCIYDNLL